jgi:2-oxo-hept-3-ene-1,7-dioate hydratase
MLANDTIAALAKELYEARKKRVPLRHFSKRFPEMTIEDGYAIQRAWVALELADGRVIKGRKIGLTSRAMQQSSQIDEPDFAPLMDDMFFAQGADIPIGRFIAPRVEVELAFILGKPLKGPGATLFDVLSATEYVTPASSSSTARPGRPAKSSTRSAISPRTPASCSAAGRSSRPKSTCAGWARCCTRTA